MRRRLALLALLVATVSAPAFLVDDPAPMIPADLVTRQCAPDVSPCHYYAPVFLEGDGSGIRVDCNHPRVWCDDEGA